MGRLCDHPCCVQPLMAPAYLQYEHLLKCTRPPLLLPHCLKRQRQFMMPLLLSATLSAKSVLCGGESIPPLVLINVACVHVVRAFSARYVCERVSICQGPGLVTGLGVHV